MKLFCVFLLLTLQGFSASAIQIPRVHSWYKTPDYPLKVFEAQGTVLDGKNNEKYITIMGGFRYFPGITTQVYTRRLFSPDATWERVQDLPVPMTHMAQARNGDLFCGGGGFLGKHPGKSIPQVLCFRQTTRKWFALPNLPGARAGGGMVFYKNTTNGEYSLIFAGGVDRLYNSLAKHIDHGTTWRLDLWKKGATWENTGATMPDPRNHMGAVESCGRYFWVGGQHKENEGSGNRKTVSEYIPSQNKWSDNPPAELPVHLGHISASVMPYKCGIMVVGGTSHGVKHQDAIYYWKPTTNKWYKVGEYKHKVATPVCGITGNTLVCGTGGYGIERNKVYVATIGTQNV